LSLAEIGEALGELPDGRTPTRTDRAGLAGSGRALSRSDGGCGLDRARQGLELAPIGD
jgi:hypothetical protein